MSIEVTDQATALTLYRKTVEWKAITKPKQGDNGSVVFEHNVDKALVAPTQHHTLNTVSDFLGASVESTILGIKIDYKDKATGEVVATSYQRALGSTVPEGDSSEGTFIALIYNGSDVLTSVDPFLRTLRPDQFRTYSLISTFETEQQYEGVVFDVTYYFSVEGVTVNTRKNYANVASVVGIDDSVTIASSTTNTLGNYQGFTTTIGQAGEPGTEIVQEPVTRTTSLTPIGPGRVASGIALYTSNDAVTLRAVDSETGLPKTYQFVNVPDKVITVLVDDANNSVKVYSPESWASDEDGILTLLWDETYGPTGGLTLSASNGVQIKFTSQETLSSNLRLNNAAYGDEVLGSYVDPDSTESVAALSGLLYLRLVLDSVAGSRDRLFDSEYSRLTLPPQSDAGLVNALNQFEGSTYGELESYLTSLLFGSATALAVGRVNAVGSSLGGLSPVTVGVLGNILGSEIYRGNLTNLPHSQRQRDTGIRRPKHMIKW